MSLRRHSASFGSGTASTEISSSPRKSELRDKIRVLDSLVVYPFSHLPWLCMLVDLLIRLLPNILWFKLACHIGCVHLVAFLVNFIYPLIPKIDNQD